MKKEFEKLAEGAGKALETLPELYDDAIKPSAQEWGKTTALIPKTINAALVPLRQWIAQKEYNLAETEKLIAEKLANINPEKIVTPESYVAVPAIQAISYSMNSEELRNLYANLISKAMNTDTKNSVHPAFVDVIKQLSPIDASVFNTIHNNELKPLIDLDVEYPHNIGGTVNAFRNLSWITTYAFKQVSVSIDNLSRLKLVSISDRSYVNDDNYLLVKNNANFKICYKSLVDALKEGQNIYETPKTLEITEFGELFYQICVI